MIYDITFLHTESKAWCHCPFVINSSFVEDVHWFSDGCLDEFCVFCVIYINLVYILLGHFNLWSLFADAIACHDQRLLPLGLSGTNCCPLELCCPILLWKLIKVMTLVPHLKRTNTHTKLLMTHLLCCLCKCDLVTLNSVPWPWRSHISFFPSSYIAIIFSITLFYTSLKNIGCCRLLASITF